MRGSRKNNRAEKKQKWRKRDKEKEREKEREQKRKRGRGNKKERQSERLKSKGKDDREVTRFLREHEVQRSRTSCKGAIGREC